MTLRYMQGFETMMTAADMRSQGWYTGTSEPRFVPSTRGQVGKSFHGFQRNFTTTAAGWPGGASGANASDIFYSTNVTLASLHAAGGFSIGYAARIMSMNALGNVIPANIIIANVQNQIVWFNGQAWAIGQSASGTYALYNSPNLETWTQAVVQPGTFTSSSALWVANDRLYAQVTNTATLFWTTDGTNWTTTNSTVNAVAQTGFVTYLNGEYWAGFGATNRTFVLRSVDGTTWTQNNISNTTVNATSMSYFKGVYVVGTTNNILWSSVGDNNPANWFPVLSSTPIRAMAQNANIIVAITANNSSVYSTDGMTWTANPFTSPYLTSQSTITYANGVFVTTLGITGTGAAIATSTNGTTWSYNPNFYSIGLTYSNAIYTNSTYGFVFAGISGIWNSVDNGATWETRFSNDPTGVTSGPNLSLTGFFVAPPNSTSAAVFTPVACVGLVPANTILDGIINYKYTNTFTGNPVDITTPTGSFTLSDITNRWRYFEMVFTAVAGTVNMFNVQIIVDGAIVFSELNRQIAPAANTTATVYLQIGKQLRFTEIDDMYFIDFAGTTNNVPFGDVTIQAVRPTNDDVVQFDKYPPTAPSNAAAVRAKSLSQASGYVEGTVDNTSDTYTSTDLVTPVFNVKAVQYEGYINKTTAASPSARLGIVSGSTVNDTGVILVDQLTPTYVSKLLERDPNGNVQWTTAAVQATKIRITKVS